MSEAFLETARPPCGSMMTGRFPFVVDGPARPEFAEHSNP